MATAITVLYFTVEDAVFALRYDVANRMPLAAERFASHGCKAWRLKSSNKEPAIMIGDIIGQS